MTDYTFSNQTEFNALSLSGGDTATATEDMAALTLASLDGSGGGIVVTANPGVTLGAVTIAGCNDLTLTGTVIEDTGGGVSNTGTNGEISIYRNEIRYPNYSSATAWDDLGTGNGIDMPSGTCSVLNIIENKIYGHRNMIRLLNPTDLNIQRNILDYGREDGIKTSGAYTGEVLVEDNLLGATKWFPRPDAEPNRDHPDLFQLLGTPTTGVTVRGNWGGFFTNIASIIGIAAFFASNGSAQNVALSQNVFATTSARLGTLDDGGSSQTITNCTGICMAAGGGNIGASAWSVTSGTITRCLQGTWKTGLGSSAPPSGGNFTLYSEYEGADAGTLQPWDLYQFAAGKQSHAGMIGTLTVEDFTPVEGGYADYDTYGASTYGAYDTIARRLAGTWGHPDLQTGGGAATKPMYLAGGALHIGGAPLLLA